VHNFVIGGFGWHGFKRAGIAAVKFSRVSSRAMPGLYPWIEPVLPCLARLH